MMVQPAQGAGHYAAPAGGAGDRYGSGPSSSSCGSAPSSSACLHGTLDAAAATAGRKRKAESQDNERLSKRLSLLKLEQRRSVEAPVETPAGRRLAARDARRDDSLMQVDDSKHKVYIYNIDDELSSDSEADDGRLVFLPDMDRHLRQNRIPPHVLASSDGELAGMQMVLYQDPRSLSVPEDKDGVRRAVIDARRRVRERQRLEREAAAQPDGDAMDMD